MNARGALREATRPDHEAVDRAFAGFDLSDTASYGRFLRAQASCIGPVESALAAPARRLLGDWDARARFALITADLAALGLEPPPPVAAPTLPDDPAVLGAAYVLEGSRFGGALLARRLPPAAPSQFLAGAAEPKLWRSFIWTLDRHLAGDDALASAITAARAVFHCFELAGRNELERAYARPV